MDKKLLERFYKCLKQKKLNKFLEYIEKNNLKETFIQSAYMDAFENKQGKDYKDLINFSLKISMDDLKNGFGEKVAKRFAELISKEESSRFQMINLISLRQLASKNKYIEQESQINEILDMFSEEGMTCGTHITGSELRGKNQ